MTNAAGWTTLSTCGCCGEGRAAPAGRAQGVALLRCSRCGTLRFSAIAPPDTIYRDGYHFGESEFGWDYAAQAVHGFEEAMASDRMSWIERFRSPGRLVDVGGGLGFLAAEAGRRGWKAELLEPVPQACEYARTRMGVSAIEAGAEALAEREGAYDAVCFVHCIEHIPPARDTLRTAARALTPSGLLFVEVPNHGSMARRLQGDRWLGWQAGEHVYVFTRRTLLRLLDAAGLEPLAVRTYVPGWEGLEPDGYAHMLGVAPLLESSVRFKRRLAALGRRNGHAPTPFLDDADPLTIRDHRGVRRAVYADGFRLLANVEERLGVGTNLQVLARPRP